MPHDDIDTLVRRFAPIGLDALNRKAAMLERIDNKYVVPAAVLAAALTDLADRFDVLEIDGRRAFTYDTCYFDDPERRSYYDHHQGRRRRMKVRVRRYCDAGLCFVEVKLKDRRGATVKRRMPYPLDQYGTLDRRAMEHVETSWRDLYGDAFERPLEPVLSMRYRRVTLVAHEGGERLTIDSEIAFLSPSGERRTDPGCFVVETKSANGNGIADVVFRRLHQHPTNACSKYCVGMSVTGAVSRFNRFRVALRKLGSLPVRAAETLHGH
jgi:VTC domain